MDTKLYVVAGVGVLILGGFLWWGTAPQQEPVVTGPSGAISGPADPQLKGTWVWKQTELVSDEVIVPSRGGFTLVFGADTLSGTTDCNSYTAGYELEGEWLTLGPVGMTKKFCEGSQEGEYISMLEDSDHYFINTEGELVLVLKFDSGTVIFTQQ